MDYKKLIKITDSSWNDRFTLVDQIKSKLSSEDCFPQDVNTKLKIDLGDGYSLCLCHFIDSDKHGRLAAWLETPSHVFCPCSFLYGEKSVSWESDTDRSNALRLVLKRLMSSAFWDAWLYDWESDSDSHPADTHDLACSGYKDDNFDTHTTDLQSWLNG